MQVVICALAKNEHLYINEWVKHYIGLGIDHIYLYDNDNIDSPYIGNYIDRELQDKITIYNIRGMKSKYLQHYIYNNFYHEHTFEWVLFCDIDEFLFGIDNVHDFLKQHKFNKFNQIRVLWKLFGDDNTIERDMTIGVKDFFKEQKHDNRLEYQNKSFIRGGLNIIITSCHYVKGLKSCFPSGKECQSDKLEITNYTNEPIYIHHYMTKTLAEFIKQKLGRGDAVWDNRSINLDYFWRINNKTQEKIEYLKNIGLEK